MDGINYPVTKSSLHEILGSKRNLSSTEAHVLYQELLKGKTGIRIFSEIDQTCTAPCDRAREASKYRNLIRAYTRSRGPYLAEKALQIRDAVNHWDIHGAQFEDLVSKENDKILEKNGRAAHSRDMACEMVEKSAKR